MSSLKGLSSRHSAGGGGSAGTGSTNTGVTGFRFTRNEEDLLEEVLEDSEQPPTSSSMIHGDPLDVLSSRSRPSSSPSNNPLLDELEIENRQVGSSCSSLDSFVTGERGGDGGASDKFHAPNTLQIPGGNLNSSSSSSPKGSTKMRDHFAAIKSKIRSLDSDSTPVELLTPTIAIASGKSITGESSSAIPTSSSSATSTPSFAGGVSASPTTDKFGSFYRDFKTKVHEVQKKFEQKRAESRRRSGSSLASSSSTSTLNTGSLIQDEEQTTAGLSGKGDDKQPQEMKSLVADKPREDEADWVNLRVTPEPDAVRYTPSQDILTVETEVGEDAAQILDTPQQSGLSTSDRDTDEPRDAQNPSIQHTANSKSSESGQQRRNVGGSFGDDHPLAPLISLFRNTNFTRAATAGVVALSIALVSPLPSFVNGLILGILLTVVALIWLFVFLIDNYFTKIQQTYDEKNIPIRVETVEAAMEYRPGSSLAHSDRDGSSSSGAVTSRQVYSDWMHEFLGDYETRIADSEEDLLGSNIADQDVEFKPELVSTKLIKSHKKDQQEDKDQPPQGSKKKTQLVYVRLDGSMLRINKPKKSFRKVREKDRAAGAVLPNFVGQRIFDLSKLNTRVYLLLPKTIRARKKYLWIKKYPICIEQENPLKSVRDEQGENIKLPDTTKITLFVHNCRDKEVWFWRLIDATKKDVIHRPLRFAITESSWGPSVPSSAAGILQGLPISSVSGKFSQIDHSYSVDDFCLPRTSSMDLAHINELLVPSSRSIPATPTNPSIPSVVVDKTAVRGVPFLYDAFMAKIITNTGIGNLEGAGGGGNGNGNGGASGAGIMGDATNSSTTLFGTSTETLANESFPAVSSSMAWFNAFTGRIFFDILSHPFWQRWLANKIQRKLARLKMPHFMPALAVTDISLGSNIPIFKSIKSEPKLDARGLWVDLDMSYSGGFMMTLETKVDLIKFKEQGSGLHEMKPMGSSAVSSQNTTPSATPTPSHSVHNLNASENTTTSTYDLEFSESEDSDLLSDSSDEENEEQASGIELEEASERAKQKVLKILDKVAASPLFQQVTDTKYVREVMEKVSNCPLILTVQILALDGVLTLNIPPPPTDRLWYAFRGKPNLVLSARPKFGDHHVSWTHMLEFIEKKLKEEFHDTLVMPNMDDLIIPALITTADQFIKVVP